MTNFPNPKPYISESKALPKSQLSHAEKMKAIKEALKIIQENERLIKAANKSSNEDLHR